MESSDTSVFPDAFNSAYGLNNRRPRRTFTEPITRTVNRLTPTTADIRKALGRAREAFEPPPPPLRRAVRRRRAKCATVVIVGTLCMLFGLAYVLVFSRGSLAAVVGASFGGDAVAADEVAFSDKVAEGPCDRGANVSEAVRRRVMKEASRRGCAIAQFFRGAENACMLAWVDEAGRIRVVDDATQPGLVVIGSRDILVEEASPFTGSRTYKRRSMDVRVEDEAIDNPQIVLCIQTCMDILLGGSTALSRLFGF